MSGFTITLGTIGVLLSLFAWWSFFGGVFRMFRIIRLGQKDVYQRARGFIRRVKTVIIEVLAHTRMARFKSVGWAHWLVMIGFILGSVVAMEAYIQTFDPQGHWPIIGGNPVYYFIDELLGLGTTIGIIALIVIRIRNHPRKANMSRFAGSDFRAAYFVEAIVLIEGLGMILVKAGKIATYGGANPFTDFFTMQLARLLPESTEMVSVFAFIKLMSAMLWLYVVGRNITWGVAWHRFSAFLNIYFKREGDGGNALGAAKPMSMDGTPLTMEKVEELSEADEDFEPQLGVGAVEDFSWKGWLDFTTCTECGRCQSQCPAWNTGKPLSPKLMMMALRDHGYAKAPYLLAGGQNSTGEETGLVDADGNPDEAKLDKIPEDARTEAERPLVGETIADDLSASGVIDPEALWSCTMCGACVEQCPVDIEHVDHFIDMRRYQVLIESEFPSELAGLFKNLETKGNPWGQSNNARVEWMKDLDFDVPIWGTDVEDFSDTEYLFWVGCAGAFEDRAKKTTQAVARLLHTAGVKYAVLATGETCTGDSARRAGNEFLFQMLAEQNIETLDGVFDGVPKGHRKIVATCAHCLNALKNEYGEFGGHYDVVHHTQLLNRLVREKWLVPVAPIEENVTYHDPCFIGRHNQIYEAPRDLMAGTGADLKEMPRHGQRSMCCGAGGARMWMEENIGKRINVDRVDEALSTNPTKIATGCPFCRVMLSDGTTQQVDGTDREGEVEVVDVANMLLESVSRADEGMPEPREPQFLDTPRRVETQAEKDAEQEETEKATAKAGAAVAGGAAAGGAAASTAAPEAPVPEAPAPEAPAPGSEASAPAAEPGTSKGAPKSGGLSLGGGAKAPGGAGAPKPPGGGSGSDASSAGGTDETKGDDKPKSAGAPKSGGLSLGGGAKAPGGAGAPKPPGGGAKKSEADSGPAEAEASATETASSATAASEAPAKSAKPAVGLGLAGGAKAPGGGPKPPGGAKAPGGEKASSDAEADSTGEPEAESTAESTDSKAEELSALSEAPAGDSDSSEESGSAESATAESTESGQQSTESEQQPDSPKVPTVGLGLNSKARAPGKKKK